MLAIGPAMALMMQTRSAGGLEMLYGINVVLFTAISVVVALYLLRRQRRILTSQLNLHTNLDS